MNQADTSYQDGELRDESGLKTLADAYLGRLLQADRHAASRMILDAVDQGTSVRDIYLNVFQPSQYEVGRLWQNNQISVAQEHFCTAATQMIMSQLYPVIFNSEKNGLRLVATCVGGELHEIGMRMVTDFFEMEGWDTYYLGANTPAESIIHTLQEKKTDIIAISASMTFKIDAVIGLISDIRASESAENSKILVGGRPFNIAPDLWRRVHADGYAPDAQSAITSAENLLK